MSHCFAGLHLLAVSQFAAGRNFFAATHFFAAQQFLALVGSLVDLVVDFLNAPNAWVKFAFGSGVLRAT